MMSMHSILVGWEVRRSCLKICFIEKVSFGWSVKKFFSNSVSCRFVSRFVLLFPFAIVFLLYV